MGTRSLLCGFKVIDAPVGGRPFALAKSAVSIQVQAIKLPRGHAEDGVAALLPQSPVRRSQTGIDSEGGAVRTPATETITLVPYAAAKPRITAFLQIDAGV